MVVKEDNYFRRERSYGKFQRSFTLPMNVNAEDIKAAYKDGLLKVEIPRPVDSKPSVARAEDASKTDSPDHTAIGLQKRCRLCN
jgi:HSP20 family molecular chaperone IbpA